MTNTKYIIRDDNGVSWGEALCLAHAQQLMHSLEKSTGWIFHLFARGAK